MTPFSSTLRIAGIAAALVPVAGDAAGPLQIVSAVKVEQRVAAPDGTTRTRLVSAGRVVPGDRVVVTLAWRNTGAQPIADVVLSNPVPAGMAYRGAAQGSPAPELSVDGTRFGALPTLRVRTASGATRVAVIDDVTVVRWRLPTPIAPGAKGDLAFQAVLK